MITISPETTNAFKRPRVDPAARNPLEDELVELVKHAGKVGADLRFPNVHPSRRSAVPGKVVPRVVLHPQDQG